MADWHWNAHNEIGVASIDHQHRDLADLVARMDSLIGEQAAPDRLKAAFEQLYDDTERHFLHEEGLFAGTGFARAAAHTRQHAGLLLILKRYREGMQHMPPPADTGSHLAFLRDWLINHIEKEDRPLGVHLNSLGIR